MRWSEVKRPQDVKLALGLPLSREIAGAPRRFASVSRVFDRVRSIWDRLVAAFCDLIDPAFSRFVPEIRLVGVALANGDVELHKVTPDGVSLLGALSGLDATALADLRAIRWGAVEIRLRSEAVLRRTLALPAASRDFLGPIIEHRLERLTPWRPDKVAYGFRVLEDTTAAPGTVAVALLAASSDIVDAFARNMEDKGLAPTVIGAADGPLDRPLPINLKGGAAGLAPGISRPMVSRVALAVLGALAALWLMTAYFASSAATEQDQIGARLVKARLLLKGAIGANTGDRDRALLDAREPDRAMVVLIDRLARAIPEDTYLKELEVTTDKARLNGISGNAPALIGKLEAAGLANVRFDSAITREKDARDSFEITADRAPTPIDPTASRR